MVLCVDCGVEVRDPDQVDLAFARYGAILCEPCSCSLSLREVSVADTTGWLHKFSSPEVLPPRPPGQAKRTRFLGPDGLFHEETPVPTTLPDATDLFALLSELDDQKEPMEQDITTSYSIAVASTAISNLERHTEREGITLLRALQGAFGDRVTVRSASGDILTTDGKTLTVTPSPAARQVADSVAATSEADVTLTINQVEPQIILEIEPQGVLKDDLVGLQVDYKIAQHVLWHFSDPAGTEPGDFTKMLMLAISRADAFNWSKLASGFPGYVLAVEIASTQYDGMDRLRDIARI